MKPVVCIGAALVDDTFFCSAEPAPGTSNPATHRRGAGGVARNIAHHLAQLGHHVELLTHFGTDADGAWLSERCTTAGIGLSHAHRSGSGTGHFAAIVSPGGELFAGAADAHCEEEITRSYLEGRSSLLASASLVIIDCNLGIEALEWLLGFCRTHAIPCVVDPVSVAKATRLAHLDLHAVLLVTPNGSELAAMAGRDPLSDPAEALRLLLDNGVTHVWMRLGSQGSRFASAEGTLILPAPRVEVTDTTGAGDAALAGWLHAWLLGKDPEECLRYGHAMAEIIVQIRGANADTLDRHLLDTTAARQRHHGL
jgi:pseudouridine kinase